MSEVSTSILNKNSLLYGSTTVHKDEGPACVDRKGEEITSTPAQPTNAPVLAVREK